MNSLFGVKIVTSNLVKPVPVLQLSNNFTACTDAFKAEVNQWLLEMFGTKEVAYVIGKDQLVMSHAMFMELKKAIPAYFTGGLK